MKNLGFCLSSKSLLIFLYLYVFLSSKIEGFETLLQLPRSGSSEIRPRSSRVITIADFGAKGDGLTDDTQAFENAWKMACSCPARSILLVPAGFTSLVHPIDFAGPCRSKVTLQISGAIVSPKNPESWTGLNPRKWLYFHGVNHLQVEGGGTINGRGQKWWDCKVNKTSPYHRAPTVRASFCCSICLFQYWILLSLSNGIAMGFILLTIILQAMTFHRCKNLKVHNLKLINSQQMHIAFTTCNQVKASHLEVIAPASSPNTDGIHISNSHNVKIKNSIVRTGDDCISIVSNSSKIQIRNIFCGPGHGISIGSLGESGSWVQVHDVKVDGAFLFNTDNGLRIKTWEVMVLLLISNSRIF
ncbi:probable polygalacturonase At1g80170 isoform X2 [Carica papaya]|uniref:probable polygalacturonase At1g80170 isoform X2 n=1 Tax=Carica papaya TaxID=3649 RepID=UPI000B8C9568|nr:probable polygalacturonase At1g80170 isoform X2 [Carica papaya]